MSRLPGNEVDTEFLALEQHILEPSREYLAEEMKANQVGGDDGPTGGPQLCILSAKLFVLGHFDPDNGEYERINLRSECLKTHWPSIANLYFALEGVDAR